MIALNLPVGIPHWKGGLSLGGVHWHKEGSKPGNPLNMKKMPRVSKVPRIDALICNVAIAQVPRLELTVDGFESQLGVNYFADFLLCGLLFDRIEQSGGRIVVVSSLAYKRGLRRIQFEDLNFEKNYSGWNAYAQSKLALMMFAYELQRRINAGNKNVQVFVCHPAHHAPTCRTLSDCGTGSSGPS